ncbi:MAG: tetratricopeptide repeat protein [Geobacteraceae bacterium]|nr:tetratricopeptide repeat protein [Geobacteraceae bacterium]
MLPAKQGTIVNRVLPLALVLTILSCATPWSALAVKWEPLARTGQHDVAIDTESVRLTLLGRLAVWLRFIPIGEQERREAAAEYGQRSYRLHLEYYEIDCSEQNAVLGLVDILGPANKRLARTKGNSTPDAIIPGSVLDLAFQKVCPALEKDAGNDEDATAAPDSGPALDEPERKQISEDSRRTIAEAVRKTESDPNNLDAWRALGNAYYDADMPGQAIAAYNRALAIKPGDTNILNDQGAMYRQTGEYSRALANFDKARQVDPSNLESLYNSAYVLAFDLNQLGKALPLWRRYLALDHTSASARQVQSFIDQYGKKARINPQK